MNHLSGRSPAHEGAQEREVLLLQLEQQLHTPGIDDGGRRGHLEPGTYEWPYRFNIPPQTNAGQELPPSYVLESGTRTKLNAVEEWASVKWYLKL